MRKRKKKIDLLLPKGMGGHTLGVCDQHIHTTIYKVGKQQRPIV